MNSAIEVRHMSKEYNLGVIGSGSFRKDFQSWTTRIMGREDPNQKIGVVRPTGKFLALNDVSLTVQKGEAVGIIGANGAGKSTLLKILSQITLPTSGEAYIYGKVSSMLEVGTGFHPELTGRENIYMSGAILGMKRREIDGKLDEIIEFSECAQFIDTPVKRYSSGMYVKLAFSVSSYLNSEIIIIDEVLSVGDARFRAKCLQKMKEIISDSDRTILCVSHSMNIIRSICSRVILLEKGFVAFEGNTDEGINLYLGAERARTFPSYIDFDAPSDYQLHNPEIAPVPVSVDILDWDDCACPWGEPLRIKFTWKVSDEPHPYCLRIIIHYDEDRLGMSISDSFAADNPGEMQSAIFELDTTSFPPGKYSFQFEIVNAKAPDLLKASPFVSVQKRMDFEITDLSSSANDAADVGDKQEPVWKHGVWGHVKLPKTRVISNQM